MKLCSIHEEFYPDRANGVITIYDTELHKVPLVEITGNKIYFNSEAGDYDESETVKLVYLVLEKSPQTIIITNDDVPDNIRMGLDHFFDIGAITGSDNAFKINRRLLKPSRNQTNILGALNSQLTTPFRAVNGGLKGKKAKNPGSDPTMLTRALIAHRKMGGRRWLELEMAFLKRSNTYKGTGGNFIRPRSSLLKYLDQLKEPWPQGEKMAQNMFLSINKKSTAYSLNYMDWNTPTVANFLKKRPKIMRPFLANIIQIFLKHDIAKADSSFYQAGRQSAIYQTAMRQLSEVVERMVNGGGGWDRYFSNYQDVVTQEFILEQIPEHLRDL